MSDVLGVGGERVIERESAVEDGFIEGEAVGPERQRKTIGRVGSERERPQDKKIVIADGGPRDPKQRERVGKWRISKTRWRNCHRRESI